MRSRSLLFALLTITLIMLAGCSTRYSTKDLEPPKAVKLDKGQAAYVALPADGFFSTTVYEGSGMTTASILRNNLLPYTSSVSMGEKVENDTQALESAAAAKARYVFVPIITNWVHRKAAWSGRSSGITIVMTLYDRDRAEGDQQILQRELRVQGRNATFVSQHPGKLAEPLLQKFVQSLF